MNVHENVLTDHMADLGPTSGPEEAGEAADQPGPFWGAEEPGQSPSAREDTITS